MNKRREAFAQGLARKLKPEEAHVAAGYKPSRNAAKLAAVKEIKARVEEIAKRIAWGETRDVTPMIEDLKDAFDKAVALGSGAGMVAARGLAAEAAKLKQLLPREPEAEDSRARRMQSLTEAEWIKLYGQPAP